MTHISLDIETLGTRPGCVVLSVALVRFSDEAHTTVNLSVPEQETLGLTQDESTLAWWMQQDPVARTLYDLAGIDKRDYDVPPPHIALNDAIAQTRAAVAALGVLAKARQ